MNQLSPIITGLFFGQLNNILYILISISFVNNIFDLHIVIIIVDPPFSYNQLIFEFKKEQYLTRQVKMEINNWSWFSWQYLYCEETEMIIYSSTRSIIDYYFLLLNDVSLSLSLQSLQLLGEIHIANCRKLHLKNIHDLK